MIAQKTWKYRVRAVLRATLGNRGFNYLDRARRWHHYRRTGVIFIHVPKAAGSTMAMHLYGRRLGHHRARQVRDENPEQWNALRKIALVREPIERLTAAHAYVMSGGTAEGAVRWRQEYNDERMKDINYFIENYLARADLAEVDPVFWPQWWFVTDDDGRIIQGLECYKIIDFDRAIRSFSTNSGHRSVPRMYNVQPKREVKRLDSTGYQIALSIYWRDVEMYNQLGCK